MSLQLSVVFVVVIRIIIILILILTYTYIFLFRVAHKANSFFHHSVQFMSRSLRSREMVCLQVVRGLPRPLLPGRFQFMACFGSLSALMRVRCPFQVRRLFWSMMLRGHRPVFSLTLEVRTLSCHLILRMRRLESKLSIRFSIVLVTAHVSAAYKTMGTMMHFYLYGEGTVVPNLAEFIDCPCCLSKTFFHLCICLVVISHQAAEVDELAYTNY